MARDFSNLQNCHGFKPCDLQKILFPFSWETMGARVNIGNSKFAVITIQ